MKNKPYTIIPYNPKLKARARELRGNMTYAEVRLWNELKQRQVRGLSFHRQKPLGEYIVDFFNKELRLVIEVDGDSHNLKQKEDLRRQRALEALGLHVLRFWNTEVKQDMPGVITKIETWIDAHSD